MAPGSPLEFTTSRASSITGAGIHQMSPSSSLRLRRLTDFELSMHRRERELDLGLSRLGVKGARNLKLDLRSRASNGLIDEACYVVPMRVSKLEAGALGALGDDEQRGLREKRDKCNKWVGLCGGCGVVGVRWGCWWWCRRGRVGLLVVVSSG